ncbi:MAG: sulfurtransferase [Gammaproteobacteria bacterium]
MTYTTLVDTETLAQNLHSHWCLFDCRFVLADPTAGERAYGEGHIPGAHYLHMDRDLAGPMTPATGRHPLPEPEVLAAKLARDGVNTGAQVVAYDNAVGAFAARLWWLLRWLGHPQVAVLDGGLEKWIKEGRPVTGKLPDSVPKGDFEARADDSLWLSSEAVLERVRTRAGCLLDARAPSRFRGEAEPIDPVAGHVPGAVNLPYMENVSENGCLKTPEVLRERLVRFLAGVPPSEAVCMCGSGVTACHNLLAMEVAGLRGAKLYAGSWSEWIRDPVRPVIRGE